ncbi:MAG TPA: ABC transporter permease subunit [Jatrophihabitans sp.]|nr:ABC transporter permease subunit [Jatrophihabitans sp.]
MTAATMRAHPAWRLPRLRGLAWVTWRQHRIALAGVVALLGGFSLLMLFNGLAMHRDYVRFGVSSCGRLTAPACQVPVTVFTEHYQGWAQFLPRFLEFLPGALGVFVGAPLVARELESGTFRFAWTQGRHRVSWIVVKLVLLGAVLTGLALAFSVMFGWWFTPFQPLMGRMDGGQAYEVTGIVFAARTLFGFMLGGLLGALIRRTVPAMAATAATWLAVVWPTVVFVRPLIEKPISTPENASFITKGGWVVSSWTQDAAGHHLDEGLLLTRARAAGVGTSDQFRAWMSRHHYASWVSYQPESRFWHFQTVEAGVYVAVALMLAALTVSWVRQRTT